MSYLEAQLNPNRILGGLLKIFRSSGPQYGFGLSVLGKAAFDDASDHGNSAANQLFQYGDTPTGVYTIIEITDGPYHNNSDSYGPNGVIKLRPWSGNAKFAESNGRKGLLIHGGKLGPGGKLRRTNGCLRLRDDELLYLKQAILDLRLSDPVTSLKVLETGTSSSTIPCYDNDKCGDGDPPPGF